MRRRPPSLALGLALPLWAALAWGAVRAPGLVGEVAAAWGEPPATVVALDGMASVDRVGPFEARPARPQESFLLASVRLPLAVNSYTGGLPDWPSCLGLATGGLPGARLAVLAEGLLLLVLAHRFLRFHGTDTAAGAVALLLATDWSFLFYKKVLAGTEVLLQASGLLLLWALWSRRWKGGRHGTIALAAGIGLGLHAKVTFLATIAAFGLAARLTRRDRPPIRPPDPVRPLALGAIVLPLLLPLVLANLHRGGPSLPSHDSLALQVARLGTDGGRESWVNLGRFLGNPLGFFHDAYGAVPTDAFEPLRPLAILLALIGVGLEWRDRVVSPSAALLRFLSLAVPIQLALLLVLNRDLHHLAQATVPLALLTALGADRVASMVAPPRSSRRALALLVLILPWLASGTSAILRTDGVVRSSRSRSFTTDGQAELVAMVRGAGARRVVTTDYELYGAMDLLAPEVRWVHAWPAVARGERDVEALRTLASGGYYLSVRPSAPLIYDWRAKGVGEQVASLHDVYGEWAALYRAP